MGEVDLEEGTGKSQEQLGGEWQIKYCKEKHRDASIYVAEARLKNVGHLETIYTPLGGIRRK